jgi:hypothetical protein
MREMHIGRNVDARCSSRLGEQPIKVSRGPVQAQDASVDMARRTGVKCRKAGEQRELLRLVTAEFPAMCQPLGIHVMCARQQR